MTTGEFATDHDGIAFSWYCTDCGAELGVDRARPDGEPRACATCGGRELAWETWNAETDPSYPHVRLDIAPHGTSNTQPEL